MGCVVVAEIQLVFFSTGRRSGLMVGVAILSQVEFGRNNHRERRPLYCFVLKSNQKLTSTCSFVNRPVFLLTNLASQVAKLSVAFCKVSSRSLE